MIVNLNQVFNVPVEILKPTPSGKSISLSPFKYLISRTDANGRILYANQAFRKSNGYSAEELLYQPHNVIQHPDMPQVIYHLLWDRLQDGKSIQIIFKNITKTGNAYWVISDIHCCQSQNQKCFFAISQAISYSTEKKIAKLYQKLNAIESQHGVNGSYKYLLGFLDERNQTFDKYIQEVSNPSNIAILFKKAIKLLFKFSLFFEKNTPRNPI